MSISTDIDLRFESEKKIKASMEKNLAPLGAVWVETPKLPKRVQAYIKRTPPAPDSRYIKVADRQ